MITPQDANEIEDVLPGGNLNTVLRRGDTVVRQSGPWSATIHQLLKHVRRKGVSWVPEPLGFDRQGNEILSFIEGEVPHDTPAWLWTETLLSEVACALRQFHDATADFVCGNACWQLASREPHEVICHSDFAPYNTTFINGHFTGLIDFDTCAPGPRIWDIAYAAYRFVPLLPMPGEIDAPAGSEYSPISRQMQQARLHRFLDAYAGNNPHLRYTAAAVLAQAALRLDTLAEFSDAEAMRSQRVDLSGHARMYRAHAAWLRQKCVIAAATADRA